MTEPGKALFDIAIGIVTAILLLFCLWSSFSVGLIVRFVINSQ